LNFLSVIEISIIRELSCNGNASTLKFGYRFCGSK
jgi:hypothetical protein